MMRFCEGSMRHRRRTWTISSISLMLTLAVNAGRDKKHRFGSKTKLIDFDAETRERGRNEEE